MVMLFTLLILTNCVLHFYGCNCRVFLGYQSPSRIGLQTIFLWFSKLFEIIKYIFLVSPKELFKILYQNLESLILQFQ